MLTVKNLCKSYFSGGTVHTVLKDITFDINKGEFVGIMGSSGSGKTTLLNTVAHFIPYDSGVITLNHKKLEALSENEMALIRNQKLGFVFQDFMLLDGLTVFENICVPQILYKNDVKNMELRANELLKLFGISQIKDKYPAEISGGEKQRAAVARAMMNAPLLVLADEPTGNLDSSSSQTVINSFLSAKEKLNATILMVTHDMYAASYCERVLLLKDGQIYKNVVKKESRESYMETLFMELKKMEVASNEAECHGQKVEAL